MTTAPVLTVHVPTYRVDSEPDHRAIGAVVDDELRRHFMGRTVVARGIGSRSHPGKTVDELVEIIGRDGTDRYDPTRGGDRYDNLQGKPIDLFAFRRKVSPRMRLFEHIVWGFYHSSIGLNREPIRIDLLSVYDATKMRAVVHQYEGRTDPKRDGFVFREPDNKPAALLGIVRIL